VQALAAGNRVVAAAPSASAALQALRDESASALPLTILHGKLAPEALATLDVDAVACAGSDAAALRAALAGREGGTGGKPVPYSHVRTASPELYDLKNDIGETTDVSQKHPEVMARLQAAAERARNALGDKLTKRTGAAVRAAMRVPNDQSAEEVSGSENSRSKGK